MRIAGWCWVLTALAASAQLPNPAAMFRRLDRDGNGRLTRDELPERARSDFDRLDRDGDGAVSEEEHTAALRRFREGAAQRRPAGGVVSPAALPPGVRLEADLPYAGTDNPRQKLDLLLPVSPKRSPLPVVVFIHGGAWRGDSKTAARRQLADLVASGEFAGAGIGYRLSDEAVFPAQIHDCKAAIRWIRAHAAHYGLDADRIAAWGASAGGHLVLLLGTAGDVPELEGTLGSHTNGSSRVTCVVNFFGPADLLTMGAISGPETAIQHDSPDSPESRLIGGAVQELKDKARAASPISYVSRDDPPFLHVHGTKDHLVPFGQAEAIHAALKKAGVPSALITVEGGGHGQGFPPEVRDIVRRFLGRHLLGEQDGVTDRALNAVVADPRVGPPGGERPLRRLRLEQ